MPHTAACRERMGKLMTEDTYGRGRERLEEHARKRGAHAAEAAAPAAEETSEAKKQRTGHDDAREQSVAEELEEAPVQAGDRRTPEELAVDRVRAGKRTPGANSAQKSVRDDVVEQSVDRPASRPRLTEGQSLRSRSCIEPEPGDGSSRMDVGMTGQKRGAEISTEVLEDVTRETGGDVDADVVLAVPIEQIADSEESEQPPGVQIGRDITALNGSQIAPPVSTLDEADEAAIASLVAQLNGTDVSEIYSPARFCAAAASLGLRPGFSADLEETAPDGCPWDLSTPEGEAAVDHLLTVEQPKLLCGAPPCDKFST